MLCTEINSPNTAAAAQTRRAAAYSSTSLYTPGPYQHIPLLRTHRLPDEKGSSPSLCSCWAACRPAPRLGSSSSSSGSGIRRNSSNSNTSSRNNILSNISSSRNNTSRDDSRGNGSSSCSTAAAAGTAQQQRQQLQLWQGPSFLAVAYVCPSVWVSRLLTVCRLLVFSSCVVAVAVCLVFIELLGAGSSLGFVAAAALLLQQGVLGCTHTFVGTAAATTRRCLPVLLLEPVCSKV